MMTVQGGRMPPLNGHLMGRTGSFLSMPFPTSIDWRLTAP